LSSDVSSAGSRKGDPGIVDQNVNRSEMCDDLLYSGLDASKVGHIQSEMMRALA
jgi:hypothetical protein